MRWRLLRAYRHSLWIVDKCKQFSFVKWPINFIAQYSLKLFLWKSINARICVQTNFPNLLTILIFRMNWSIQILRIEKAEKHVWYAIPLNIIACFETNNSFDHKLFVPLNHQIHKSFQKYIFFSVHMRILLLKLDEKTEQYEKCKTLYFRL